MIYLSGAVRPEIPDIGFMMTPHMGNKLPIGRTWAADNGRFNAPHKYTDTGYLSWLQSRSPSLCLFATAPDVVGDHAATAAMSAPILPMIRALGYRAAFVAQNGFADAPWDEFDALFLGGNNAFKLGPYVPAIVREAKRRGKWVHMGRVNSYQRLRLAKVIGCDSCDGTFLKYGPDVNTPRLMEWLRRLDAEPLLVAA